MFIVLIAHNGYVYDYPILLAEVFRRDGLLDENLLSMLHFSDTLPFIREVPQYMHTDTVYQFSCMIWIFIKFT